MISKRISNYARNIGEFRVRTYGDGRVVRKYTVEPTGEYVFFDSAAPPSFSHPERWAFFKQPKVEFTDTFRGSLVGTPSPAAEID